MAASVAKNHMYFDDFLGGSDSDESAQALVGDLQNLFQHGGFLHRKWALNEPLAIEDLPDSLKANSLIHLFNPDSSH